MRIIGNQEKAALIEAIGRVYASGLSAANSSAATIRQDCAKADVDHFIKTIEELDCNKE